MMNREIKIILLLIIINLLNAQGYGLRDCIDIALEGKTTIHSSELEVLSAEQGLKGSYSGLLPSINASTNSSRTQFPESSNTTFVYSDSTLDAKTITTDHYNNLSAAITLNQTIYDGGRSVNQIKQAKSQLEIAKLGHRNVKIQVIQKVIESYYGLLKAQQLHQVSIKNLEMSNQQIFLVKKQYDLGVVKKTDLLKAEVALGQAKVELLSRKTNLENMRRVLFNDMGLQDFGQDITATEEDWIAPVIPNSSDILNQLKKQNPSLLISNERIFLAEIAYKMSRGMRLPNLNSSLSYSANGENSTELMDAIKEDWSLGMNISFNIPIYTGNTLNTQQFQAKINKDKYGYDYITLLNDLRVQGELIRKTLENYSEIIPINKAVVAAAEEDLKLVRERYSLGSATILEVLDAQVSLIRANSTLINTIHDARVQEANLKSLLGTLDIEYQIKEN